MNVSAGKREFRIYDLFCHDHEAASVHPFSQWKLAEKLNELAVSMFPDHFIQFVCPDDSGLSQWNVKFNKDRCLRWSDSFETYPTARVYDERTFRRQIPAELDEVLLELDKAGLIL